MGLCLPFVCISSAFSFFFVSIIRRRRRAEDLGGWLGKGAGKRAWEASGAIFKQPPDRNNAQAGRPMSGTETTAHESWFHN
jgi:hypothetical protein